MPQIAKRALAASRKRLPQQKPLNKITINDINEDCGVNRMTFYHHVQDIYALAERALQRDPPTGKRSKLKKTAKNQKITKSMPWAGRRNAGLATQNDGLRHPGLPWWLPNDGGTANGSVFVRIYGNRFLKRAQERERVLYGHAPFPAAGIQAAMAAGVKVRPAVSRESIAERRLPGGAGALPFRIRRPQIVLVLRQGISIQRPCGRRFPAHRDGDGSAFRCCNRRPAASTGRGRGR